MKRRLLSLFVAILLVLPMALPAAAATGNSDELSDATIERVKQEVLSGNITDEEDVLNVALAQYASRAQSAAYGARSGSTAAGTSASIDGEDVPSITQVIEETTDENGAITRLIADTGLHVTDASGRTVTIDQLYLQDTFSLDYSITATHTVYFYYKYDSDPLTSENYVKFDRMVTALFYGANPVTQLKQYYCVDVNGIPQQYLEQTVTNPTSGARYSCTSSHAAWEYSFDHPYPGFSTLVLVTCNGVTQEFSMDINSVNGMDYTGTW